MLKELILAMSNMQFAKKISVFQIIHLRYPHTLAKIETKIAIVKKGLSDVRIIHTHNQFETWKNTLWEMILNLSRPK